MTLRDVAQEELLTLASVFRDEQRCYVRDPLRDDVAHEIRAFLKEAAWRSSRSSPSKGIDYSYAICTPDAIISSSSPGARSLARIISGIGGAAFRQFVGAITGLEGSLSLNARVSRYSNGDFIGPHCDTGDDDKRRVAYVFDLSDDLTAGEGGSLVFPCGGTGPRRRYHPRFNSLVLFAVPQRHYVSKVNSHNRCRFTITGWFSDMPTPALPVAPPGPFPL